MADEAKPDDFNAIIFAFFALLATAGAGVAWLDALDFDPCNSILTSGGAGCIEPGIAGLVIGGVIALFGLAILGGAIVGRKDAQAPVSVRLCLGWVGLMFAACGGAIAYAQLSVGL